MFLRIKAKQNQDHETTPLFGCSVNIVIQLAESRRNRDGEPRQKWIGSLAKLRVESTALTASPDDLRVFWKALRDRMDGFGVPVEKQKQFIAQIKSLLEEIATVKAHYDSDLWREFQTHPNKVLSKLRKVADDYEGK